MSPASDSDESFDGASSLVGTFTTDGTAALTPGSLDGQQDKDHSVPANPHTTFAVPVRRVDDLRSKYNTSSQSISSSSEEDYDTLQPDPSAMIAGSKGGGAEASEGGSDLRRNSWSPGEVKDEQPKSSLDSSSKAASSETSRPPLERQRSVKVKLEKTDRKGRYILVADDRELREVLREGLEYQTAVQQKKQRPRFRDLVFTRQFTAFDRQNPQSAESPFHGFFTLFWLGTALLLLKIAAQNWKTYGSIFGRHEILDLMFRRDVAVMGLTDGVMCGSTAFCVLLQKAIVKGYLRWNREGWIIQNIWQTFFLGAVIGWSRYRNWPWTHTVFIVLHCMVMLMKQHSYAFYNGYLSEVYRRKTLLEKKLRELKDIEPDNAISDGQKYPTALSTSREDPQHIQSVEHRRHSLISKRSSALNQEHTEVAAVAAAIESGDPLNLEQIESFERIINWELDDMNEELKGKCSETHNCFPSNLNIKNFAEYIVLPTVVYELEYPRQEKINWWYVAEKTAATFGSLIVMQVVSEAYIYPHVMRTVEMKEQGMPLIERLQEFPWVLSDMMFPFMMEYLLSWYVIWECILNVLAEVTRFADRGFYGDWWNSVSWDQYARDWNRPVHNFLLRHVYHSSISAFHLSRSSATLVTFFLSSCIHELVMWCIFNKLRGYLLAMQMLQIPLVMLSQTRFLKGRTILGNAIFWLGIMTGPSFLCSLYLII
ncbi:MAG: hypothetical protein M1819_001016 [Sarea resinae]|nr:MAG: hypothetical protein M1819_001016 [Sarea resinae]